MKTDTLFKIIKENFDNGQKMSSQDFKDYSKTKYVKYKEVIKVRDRAIYSLRVKLVKQHLLSYEQLCNIIESTIKQNIK